MLLQKYFETRFELIDEGLQKALSFDESYAKDLKKAIQSAVIPGGKRWRPLLLLSMFEMLTGFKKNRKLNDAVYAAVAVELIHNAAFIHDDLPSVMNRQTRRGQPALHVQYNNAIAILASDALYTLAFETLGEIKDAEKALEATRILSNYAKSYGLIGGQAVDLANRRKVMKINTLRYIDMKKVGSMLQASADIACCLAGADENARQIMSAYALNLGIAYQMIEDIEADYARGSDGLDDEYIPVSKASYTGLLGFDKARKAVENMLEESKRMIKPFANNSVLMEFVSMIKERLP
ncbi:MAG: geranyl transferase [Candidatus Cloacimonetes bacterium HGW-Cloacimonetes-3]|nr:MAG: geranyl transferase [Candidatus Cloacimonetes bacterium HGW-Cloacimonetes-3]